MLGAAAVKAKSFTLASFAFKGTKLSSTEMHGHYDAWAGGGLFFTE